MAARLTTGLLTAFAVSIALLTACAWANETLELGQRPNTHSKAAAGEQAWTQARTSPGLHRIDEPTTVTYTPASMHIPADSVITAVYADRHYVGQARVQTSLCWNGRERCVNMTAGVLNTKAFAGLDARRPFHLVHRVVAWNDSPKPLFVRGNVTVWFAPPATPVSPSS